MFNDSNKKITITLDKGLVCYVLLTIMVLTSIIFLFFHYHKNDIPVIDKEISSLKDNANYYVESILDASKNNDISNNNGFSNVIDNVFDKIFNKYSDKFNFSEEERRKFLENYHNKRTKIINNIHDTLINTESLQGKKDFRYDYLDSVNGFSESLSAFACGIVSLSLSEASQVPFAKDIFTEYFCKDILIEIVSPVTQVLKDKAIVKDVNNISFNMKERIRSSVSQLATSRDEYYFDIEDKQVRIIAPFENSKFEWLKKNTRTERESEIRAKIKATVIAGFDLKDFSMNVQSETRTLSIYLPSPVVIQDNIAVEFTGENSEFLAPEIDYNSYNSIHDKAKIELKDRIKNSDLFDKAKESAVLSIMNIFQPLMSMPQFNYEVQVYFDNKMITKKKNKE